MDWGHISRAERDAAYQPVEKLRFQPNGSGLTIRAHAAS
jgi:hypothetical protein